MEEAKEVVLTYETLYELLRREKSRAELQQLDANFFADALHYLREKQQAYDDNLAKNDIFSQSERDKLHIQLNNIRRILRDLYDVRERKIINMAINHTRTNAHIVDAEHLVPQERPFFDSLNAILKQYRTGILSRIVELREPDVMPIVLPLPEQEKVSQPEKTKKHLRFLQNVDQFVGEELETYGPYAENDQAELPSEIAEVLINQEKAIEI